MPSQSLLLTHYQRQLLEQSLQTESRLEYRRRIEIMLLFDAGKSQTQICKMLGCAHETARYWIAVARSGNIHSWQEQSVGRPKTVNQQYRDRLQELVSHSPREYGYSFRNWTANWLRKHLAQELGIDISDRYINHLLKEMGLSTRGQKRKLATNHSSSSA